MERVLEMAKNRWILSEWETEDDSWWWSSSHCLLQFEHLHFCLKSDSATEFVDQQNLYLADSSQTKIQMAPLQTKWTAMPVIPASFAQSSQSDGKCSFGCEWANETLLSSVCSPNEERKKRRV